MGFLLCPCTRLFSRVTQWQTMPACSGTAVNSVRPSYDFAEENNLLFRTELFSGLDSFKNGPQTG